MRQLDARIPEGPIAEKWTAYRSGCKLVSPANRRKLDIIVVGTGLAGASAAATLGELGYAVKAFCYQDSPRRAHSIAAQGGINAAKNYRNDGDSVFRLFHDTLKGGDYRSREANVYRLAEESGRIIDLCVAQGVPFAREYGGLLLNRSFGGTQVSRTFYARGQTGQQLLLGAYGAMSRQIAAGTVELFARRDVLDIVVIEGRARGIIARNLVTGEIEHHAAHAVVLASGGYGNVFYLSTNAMGSNGTPAWSAYRKGALFANPSFTQIHPTCLPAHGDWQSKLPLMSECLRNDGRIWVPASASDAEKLRRRELRPSDIPEMARDYYLERRYPAFGNLVPRDVASRAAKERCDAGFGVNSTGMAVFLDFADAIDRLGREKIDALYGNLFEAYRQIVDEDPYGTPMMIYPAVHYTMGGLWVDYELMTTIPGLFAIGECNFSDHGANRLGASALMQGLADGYFILPATIGNYLSAEIHTPRVDPGSPEFRHAADGVKERLASLMQNSSGQSVDHFHRRLGRIMWDYCGMSRSEEGLRKAQELIADLREEYPGKVRVPGRADRFNPELEKAWRVGDFIDLAALMAGDALQRQESCGGHFREEFQTGEGEALRNDREFAYVAAWEHQDGGKPPLMHREPLEFREVPLSQRSYK